MNALQNVTVGAVKYGKIHWLTPLEQSILDELSTDLGFNYTIKRYEMFAPIMGNCSRGECTEKMN